MKEKYTIRWTAKGEHGGEFETYAFSEAEKDKIVKSLRADPDVIQDSIKVVE